MHRLNVAQAHSSELRHDVVVENVEQVFFAVLAQVRPLIGVKPKLGELTESRGVSDVYARADLELRLLIFSLLSLLCCRADVLPFSGGCCDGFGVEF